MTVAQELDRLEQEGLLASDPATLLDDVKAFLKRFIAFPSDHSATAVALWVLHTHVLEAFDSTPRLAFLSPEKGSGKTRALEVLELLVPDPMHASNLSAAAIFRQISAKPNTVLLADEADTYLGFKVAKDHEDLRGLVNAGHRRGASVYRCVGEPSKMQVQEFPAFCAVVLAGIGDLPDTIIDRSIVNRMRRRSPTEIVEPFRHRKARPQGEALRDRIALWGASVVESLKDVEPELPAGIVDRPADVWEPLIVIADQAGPEWSNRARSACVELQKERQASDPSLGIQLLADVRRVFEETDTDRLFSKDLVDKLCDIEEAPWGDIRGKAMDARGLARRLKPYQIHPHQIRIGDESLKGYETTDFYDAWKRYLLPPQNTETTETKATEQVTGPDRVSHAEAVSFTSETRSGGETESGPTSRDVAAVSLVSPYGGSKAEDEPLSVDAIAAAFEADEVWGSDDVQTAAAKVRAWNNSLPSAPSISDIPTTNGRGQ